MALSPRKDERAAIAELLEQDWTSADDLAGAIIKTAFELIQARTLYGLRWEVGGGTLAVGPFAQEKDAERFYTAHGGDRGAVARLHGPSLFPAPTKGDDAALCGCGHPKGTHDHAKGKGWCWARTKDKDKRGCDCTQYERRG